MSLATFKKDLQDFGIEVFDIQPDKVYFEYKIPTGTNAGCRVFIGMSEMDTYPANVPSKVHVKQIDELKVYPTNNIQESAFGNDWKYWSRSFVNWGNSARNIKTFLANIKDIFEKAGKEV